MQKLKNPSLKLFFLGLKNPCYDFCPFWLFKVMIALPVIAYLIYDVILCLLVKSGTLVHQRKCECHVLQLKPHHQEESRILKAYKITNNENFLIKEANKLNSYSVHV